MSPISLPVIPPEGVARYVALLGIDTQIERGEGKRAEIPQWLADRLGWEELVERVTAVYLSLPENERYDATLLAPSYGHAGALELLGGRDLPPVLSPHNTYHSWGRDQVQRLSRGVAISIGFGEDVLGEVYESVDRVAVYDCDLCMNWRRGMPIYVARGPMATPKELSRLWERARHYE